MARKTNPNTRKSIVMPKNVYKKNGSYFYREILTGDELYLGRSLVNVAKKAAILNADFACGALRAVNDDAVRADELLDEAELMKMSEPRSSHTGIYFLWDRDRIIYVGCAKNCYGRVEQHDRDQVKPHDRFTFLACGANEMELLEARYIGKFMPIYNKAIPRVIQKLGKKPE